MRVKRIIVAFSLTCIGLIIVISAVDVMDESRLDGVNRAATEVQGATVVGVSYQDFSGKVQKLAAEILLARDKFSGSSNRSLANYSAVTEAYSQSLSLWGTAIRVGNTSSSEIVQPYWTKADYLLANAKADRLWSNRWSTRIVDLNDWALKVLATVHGQPVATDSVRPIQVHQDTRDNGIESSRGIPASISAGVKGPVGGNVDSKRAQVPKGSDSASAARAEAAVFERLEQQPNPVNNAPKNAVALPKEPLPNKPLLLPLGGAYRVGGSVLAPLVLFKVDPSYSEEARKAKYSGTVLVQLIVDTDGSAKDIRVVRSLGLGLDEKAVEAVGQWRFKPGMKDSQPVPVIATIEVNFRLIDDPPQN